MIRNYLKTFFESTKFQNIIISLIIINAILIGMETSPAIMSKYGSMIDIVDMAILGVFCLEIILKLYTFKKDFFKEPWNIFDFVIVAISIIPAAGSFSVFRALRIIRTLRLLKTIPKLKVIIESLLQSIPSIGWIAVLLGIVYYTFAIIGINLFGAAYPEYFGSLKNSFFTLFQIMTLESWSTAIARPIMDGIPFAGLYFVCFILIATYTTLNIFIAIVVSTMNELSLKGFHDEEEQMKEFVLQENARLHEKLDLIQAQLNVNKIKAKQVKKGKNWDDDFSNLKEVPEEV